MTGQAVEKAAYQEASGNPGRETEGTEELQEHQAVGIADRQRRQAEGKERVAFRLGRPCQGEGRAACLDRHQGGAVDPVHQIRAATEGRLAYRAAVAYPGKAVACLQESQQAYPEEHHGQAGFVAASDWRGPALRQHRTR